MENLTFYQCNAQGGRGGDNDECGGGGGGCGGALFIMGGMEAQLLLRFLLVKILYLIIVRLPEEREEAPLYRILGGRDARKWGKWRQRK